LASRADPRLDPPSRAVLPATLAVTRLVAGESTLSQQVGA
jgi:hypothetical protein